MADEQEAAKKTSKKETTKKKVQAGEVKATPAAEVVSPPAATARVTMPKKSMKKAKLLSKNKHRLPRRQKKAQQKAAIHLQK
jgi:hypothetical protein